ERAAAAEATSGRHKINGPVDNLGNRDFALHARGALMAEAAPGRWFQRHRRVWLGWRRRGLREERDKVLARLPEPHEEVGHVAAVANLFREVDDLGTGNHPSDAQRPCPAGLIAVEADEDFGYRSQLLCPFP